MPLINCKVEISLKRIENYMITTVTTAKPMQNFIYQLLLSSEDNVKLSKLLSEGFKRPIYWNEYKVLPNKIVEIAANNEEK